jgi:hypothetical protein
MHIAGVLNKVHAKTRNAKWNEMKNGTFSDKLCDIFFMPSYMLK